MLAKPTKAITEVLDRFEGKSFTCEYKYDGERAQVHFLEDGSIKVFSRNSLDMTSKYPEFTESLPRVCCHFPLLVIRRTLIGNVANRDCGGDVQCIQEGTTSFVIDAEAVAWDRETHKLLPFQELSRRKRKDVKAEEITVKVHLFAFDLLYLNGEVSSLLLLLSTELYSIFHILQSLLHVDLGKRRELMRKHLQPVEGEFAFATSEDATDVADIQIFLDKSVKEGCEGLMVKLLEGEGASYEPSRRSINWLKVSRFLFRSLQIRL
jgi:DNA ligase-1